MSRTSNEFQPHNTSHSSRLYQLLVDIHYQSATQFEHSSGNNIDMDMCLEATFDADQRIADISLK